MYDEHHEHDPFEIAVDSLDMQPKEERMQSGWIFRYDGPNVAVTTARREEHNLEPIATYRMPRGCKTLADFRRAFFDPERSFRRYCIS